MTNLPHAVAKCAEIHPIIAPGLTYTAGLIWSSIALVIGAVSGWYVKGRGMAGVKLDLDNVKADIVNLRAKIDAPKVTDVPVA
jgi:hypothetical protein